jgi:hypothetical protein
VTVGNLSPSYDDEMTSPEPPTQPAEIRDLIAAFAARASNLHDTSEIETLLNAGSTSAAITALRARHLELALLFMETVYELGSHLIGMAEKAKATEVAVFGHPLEFSFGAELSVAPPPDAD